MNLLSHIARRHQSVPSPAWLVLPAALLALAAGGSLLGTAPVMEALRLLHSGVDYHPDSTHSFFLDGQQSVICARNTGIYAGALLTLMWAWATGRGQALGFPPLRIALVLALFVGVMVADGFNSLTMDLEYPTPYQPHNLLRLGTGLLAGLAVGAYVLPVVNSIIWRNGTQRAVVPGFGSLGALLTCLGLLWAVVALRLDAFALPVAALTTAASFVLFGIVNVLFLVLILRRENRYAGAHDLARLGAVAVVIALAQLAILAVIVRTFIGLAQPV